MKVEVDYLGREGDQWEEERWGRERAKEENTAKVYFIYMYEKCHNEMHYLLQLIYAKKN
jgi:hypothetical protein